ncbi:PD-(D/E)XK nuclease family protein [Infirmifilum sp. SLHALR2]
MELVELKSRVLRLLREDEEFRYAVAGLIGLDDVLRRLDRHEERMVKLEERMLKVEEELVKLREDMNKLREDMIRGFERHDKEIAELREDMKRGFERYDRELAKLREDMNKGFERYDREIARLREDMNRGFELVNRHLSALGARWGIMAEDAFREGLRGVLEKELGLRVERWSAYDEAGEVFGYPSEVEVDIAVKDGKIILIEVSSHVRASDVYCFKRKAEFYAKKTGEKPERLVMITPYAEERAVEASKKLGIEVYTKV